MMSNEDQYQTRYSLLERALDPHDEEAWQRLYGIYEKFIYHILRQMNTSENDIADIAQQCVIKLMRDLKNYDRTKGQFRSWFRTVVRNTALMYFRKEGIAASKMELYEEHVTNLENGGREALFEIYVENEWKEYLYRMGIERVQARFRGRGVEVFELAMKGMKTQEIAEELKLPVNTVQTLRNRVKKALSAEIKNLLAELEGFEGEGS